jgi:demethylmenaquinone methyltransferase / 2-methoxy-6-polyprenyl-1,4-benzoquinol methylase
MADVSERDPRLVRGMFDGIAPRYDLLNRLLSLSLDRRWRRRAAEELVAADPQRVLDLCGGTGDLSVAVLRTTRAELVICCDFARAMLGRAARKLDRAGLADRAACVLGDGLALPFRDASFDALTVGFGVRNLVDLDAGLREMARVLGPAGRLVVLEFTEPPAGVAAWLYRLYLSRILPRVGDSVSGRSGPYHYLARTIAAFPGPAILAGRIREAGFAACGWWRMSGGIVAVHTAIKDRA